MINKVFSLYPYRGVVKEMLRLTKFSRIQGVAEFWGSRMLKDFPMFWQYETIIPVPSRQKIWNPKPGVKFTQIARFIKRSSHLPVIFALAKKGFREIKSLSGKERGRNTGNFRWKGHNGLLPQRVLLIDDILTTGSTVKECSQILHSRGACLVDVLVIARV